MSNTECEQCMKIFLKICSEHASTDRAPEGKASCPACGRELSQMTEIVAILHRSTESPFDEEALSGNRKKVMAAVRRHRSHRGLYPQVLRFVSAASAAAAVVFALLPSLHVTDQPEDASVSNIAVTEIASTHGKESLSVSPWSRFAELRSLFEKAKERGQTELFAGIYNDCMSIAEANTNSSASHSLLKLASDCQMQMADTQKAQEVFLRYVECIKQNKGEDAAAQALLNRANSFFAKRDYLLALSYYDELRSRFPNSRLSEQASYMTGQYYLAIGQPEQAIRELELLAAQDTISAEAHLMARTKLAQAYYNTGKYEKAFSEYEGLASEASSPDEASRAYFHMGLLAMGLGENYFPKAIGYFETIQNKYPDQPAASGADKMIHRMRNRVLDDVSKDIFKLM